jgi:predicted Ser/Thr protein kinase
MICPACQAPNDGSSETCIHCGRGLYALTLGDRLGGRYEITGVLGRGGMGVVYLARDLELEETVALKVLRREIADSEEAARRFRSEIKLARKIRHRNVCGIHEYGQDPQRALRFIVMEYVEGSTLRQVLRQRGRLPAGEAFDVAIEVAEGLQAVHDTGIIHRDLKATNVMLDRTGLVRLMDFGIAKQLQEDTSGITATAQMVGTPEYMSPEQVRSEKLDGRSDVYSLGILIFELFTGELPFHGETPMSVIMAHLETPPPLEGARASWLPRSLVPVLRKALAKDRNERYRSPREVAEALRAARAALAGPTLVQPRSAAKGGAAALPVAAAAPDSLSVSAPTPVGTPTPVVGATTPLPRPARHTGPSAAAPPPVPPATRRLAPARQEAPAPPFLSRLGALPPPALVGGGAALATFVVLVVVVASWLRLPSTVPTAAPATAAPSPAATATATPAPTLEARTSEPAAPVPPPVPAAARVLEKKPEARSLVPPVAAEKARPTPTPAPQRPRPAPTPATTRFRDLPVAPPTAPTPAVEAANGTLKLRVVPWAEVSLDGRLVGTTPLRPLSLPAGDHTVRLQHPSYRPLQKKVTVRAGEVFVLEVDLAEEAFPLPPKEQ